MMPTTAKVNVNNAGEIERSESCSIWPSPEVTLRRPPIMSAAPTPHTPGSVRLRNLPAAGGVQGSMRLKIVIALGALLVAASGTAAAKFASYNLTIDGPGMASPAPIHQRRAIGRVSIAMLIGTNRTRIERPRSRGPAYLLEYSFGVGDANGSRTETIRQTLYPFATGGPVVFTPRRQKIDMSYGPVRFAAGWFEVPQWVMQTLEGAGLPQTPPEPDAAPARARLDSPNSEWGWLTGLGLLTAGGGIVAARRRQLSRPKVTRRHHH
jgi:hypothetical protein